MWRMLYCKPAKRETARMEMLQMSRIFCKRAMHHTVSPCELAGVINLLARRSLMPGTDIFRVRVS